MLLSEMWMKKPTDVWLHRLNKDGQESGARDARRYYASKQDAINHHNHMVDANPGKEIAHNLHVDAGEMGHFKMKLIGRQAGKAEGVKRNIAMDEFVKLMNKKGSAANAWLSDRKWEELLKLYNAGADIKVVAPFLKKEDNAADVLKRKVEMMEDKGYKLFAHGESVDVIDMIFVRN